MEKVRNVIIFNEEQQRLKVDIDMSNVENLDIFLLRFFQAYYKTQNKPVKESMFEILDPVGKLWCSTFITLYEVENEYRQIDLKELFIELMQTLMQRMKEADIR